MAKTLTKRPTVALTIGKRELHTDPSNRFVFVSCTYTHGKQSGFGRARCSHVYAALTHLGATK